jgi:tetratricopeptide (TPR) repeat protein
LILTKIALEIESHDLARKRLIQSESFFRKGINLKPKDSYCYQGLAQLYLGWAKRSQTEAEAADYIAKAETAINDGLKIVRMRDGLWIESANIQKYLGDNPKHLRALEKAVQDTPGSIIARYLLGRTYRREERFKEAEKILKPNVKNHPDEYRSFVEYTLILYNLGKTFKECIAILKQSTLYGYSDPRFIATLGGMMFMDGSFTEAEEVFELSIKRDFTASELNRVQFRPIDPLDRSNPHRLKGQVIDVKAGYSWVETPGYPKSFLCPGSKYRGIMMKKGLKLTFEPAFTAKGPIANNPKIIAVAQSK